MCWGGFALTVNSKHRHIWLFHTSAAQVSFRVECLCIREAADSRAERCRAARSRQTHPAWRKAAIPAAGAAPPLITTARVGSREMETEGG